jgi:hypothetical protein
MSTLLNNVKILIVRGMSFRENAKTDERFSDRGPYGGGLEGGMSLYTRTDV